LAVLRLENSLNRQSSDLLRKACSNLLRRFCAERAGEVSYLEELLHLASAYSTPGTEQLLAELARAFNSDPRLAPETELAVLAALVDTKPPQPPTFWLSMLEQDAKRFAGFALSGVLATYPEQAAQILPRLPNSERLGQAAALKLDLAWDELHSERRHRLVEAVERSLSDCNPSVAGPLQAWVESKTVFHPAPKARYKSLRMALEGELGAGYVVRARTPKLCRPELIAA
jgi:hypothetical protein